MNQDLQNLEIKVENDGTTPQGRVSATEWNILVAAVKSLDLTGGSADAASILQVVANAGYATQEWVTSQKYITSSALDNLAKNLVTLDTTQAITGMKDFTNGLKISGLSVYKSQADTIYLDANLVVRGGITAFGTNETITPSIFEALPIDGATLKRTENGVLYVDATVVGGGGTGGGISIEDLEGYFASNFTKATIKSTLGISDWALESAKPTYTAQEVGAVKESTTTHSASLNDFITAGIYRFNVPADTTEGMTNYGNLFVVRGGTNDTFSQLYFNHSGDGRIFVRSGSKNNYLSHSWKTLAFTSDIPTSLKNPNALSWSGYSSGSYDGSSAQSITIPNNTNQLINGAGFITGITGTMVTNALGYTPYNSANFTKVNIKNTLGISDWALASAKPSYAWTEITSRPTNVSAFTNDAGYITSSLTGTFTTTGYIRTSKYIETGYLQLTSGIDDSFRTSVFGDAAGWGRMKALCTGGKATGNYGVLPGTNTPVMAFAMNDTHAFIAIPYAASKASEVVVGGGNADKLNWSATLLHSLNYSDYALPLTGGTVFGNLLVTGGVTATNSSDERLKRNIRKFNASEVLMSLGGIWEYEYVDSEVERNHIYKGTHYGLIYQNVKGTNLDVMCHEREDGMGALNYIHQKFISLIAGATMENISEVEKLKRQIRHLEAKVKQLENRA